MAWFDAFLPMHTVTRGRLRRARWMSLWLTLGAFALYCVTLCRFAYPGRSAELLAQFAGLSTREAFDRPVLHFLGGLIADWIGHGNLAVWFNLLAALLAAISVGGIYRVVWYLVDEFMREESSVRIASRVSFRVGLLTAIVLATCLPFWSAATRFSTATVDFFCIVQLLLLVCAYGRRFELRWMLIFAFFSGILCAESVTFLLLMPFFGFLWLCVEWAGDERQWRPRMTASVLLFILGFALDHLLSALQAQSFLAHAPYSLHLQYKTSLEVFRQYWNGVRSVLPGRYWLVVILTGCGLLPMAWASSLRTLRNWRGYGLLALLVLQFSALIIFIFNLKGSSWSVWAIRGEIPVVSTLAAVLAFGLVAACLRALISMESPQEFRYNDLEAGRLDEFDEDVSSAEQAVNHRLLTLGSLTGIAGWSLLLLAAAIAVVRNGVDVATDQGAFADVLAERVLDEMGSRSWVVTDEVGGANLLLAAHKRGRSLLLLQPYRTGERYYRIDVRRRFASRVSEHVRLRAQRLLDQNFILFLEELFLSMPAIEREAVSLAFPDLWYNRERKPHAGAGCFLGEKRTEPLDLKKIAEAKQFWESFAKLLEKDSTTSHLLSARLRRLTAQRISMLMNNCAVELDDSGESEQAFTLLRLAQRVHAENVSVVLNLYDLAVSRQVHPETAGLITRELNRIVQDRSVRLPLWALGRFYGYVRNYELFLRRGLSWVISSCPESVLITLQNAQRRQVSAEDRNELLATLGAIYAMQGDVTKSRESFQRLLETNAGDVNAIRGLARMAMQGGEVNEMRRLLDLGTSNGLSVGQLGTEWALYYLASGELEKARVLMQRCLDTPTGTAPADLALLGVIMLAQKDTKAVSSVLIPRLAQQAKNSKDRQAAQYYLSLLQGCYFREQEGDDAARKARASYLQAVALRPNTTGLMELVLSLDVRLRDESSAELHAINILRRNKTSPFANYVLGTIRLSHRQFGDALIYLQHAISATKPTSAALNNYAEVLVRLGRGTEAETVARRLIRDYPEFATGLSTLAGILIRNGQFEEPKRLIERIQLLEPDYRGLDFLRLRLAHAQGRKDDALALLKKLQDRRKSLLAWEERDLRDLEADLLSNKKR